MDLYKYIVWINIRQQFSFTLKTVHIQNNFILFEEIKIKNIKMNSKLLALFVVIVSMAVSSYAASLSVPFEYEVESIGKCD